jgi:hypothetical protein
MLVEAITIIICMLFQAPTKKLSEWFDQWLKNNRESIILNVPVEEHASIVRLKTQMVVMYPFMLDFKTPEAERSGRLLEYGTQTIPPFKLLSQADSFLESIFPEFSEEANIYVFFSS